MKVSGRRATDRRLTKLKDMYRRGRDWRRVDEMQERADRGGWRLLHKSTHRCGNDWRRKKKKSLILWHKWLSV
jgi:hypothetical protein